MQQEYTGTHPTKRQRHKTRKFSANEPYDRATEAMLANSSLSGMRKLSLEQGSLIQSNPNALQGAPQTCVNVVPYTSAGPTPVATSNNLTAFPEAYSNPQVQYAQQNYIPPSYNIQGLGQPGLVQNPTPVNYNTEGLNQQQFYINQAGTQGLPQQNYVVNPTNQAYIEPNNLTNVPQAGYTTQGLIQQNFSQPGLITGTELAPSQVITTTYVNNTEVQNYPLPPIIGGIVQESSLPPVPSDAHANTLPQTHVQPGPTATTVAAPQTEVKKIDPNSAGIFTFKPLEAKFPRDNVVTVKSDPYCKVKIGLHSGKTSTAKNQGTHPVWNDAISLHKKKNEQFAKLKVRDNDKFRFNEAIGETKIPLGEIATRGKINQWYPIYRKEQLAGEVLMEITFQPKTIAP